MTVQAPSTQTEPAVDDSPPTRSTSSEPDGSPEQILARMHALDECAERTELRDRVIESTLPLANRLAGRFTHRGESFDDLFQVATVGLIKAVDGFEPERGLKFSSYAVPTILGELKRHFRDKSWDVRLPRRVQELVLDIRKVSAEFMQDTGRSPTVADLVARLDAPTEQVIEALTANEQYRTLSLDAPVGDEDDDSSSPLVDTLSDGEDIGPSVEDRVALEPLIANLPNRERTILMLRFYGNHTQSQIAARLGISQMHVSRLLSTTLARLREAMLDDRPAPRPADSEHRQPTERGDAHYRRAVRPAPHRRTHRPRPQAVPA